MRYQARQTMRLIRTTHQVTITNYGTVEDLIDALKRCPLDAKITDRDIDDFGNYILTFEQESQIANPDMVAEPLYPPRYNPSEGDVEQ